MSSLYQITEDILALERLLEEAGGDVSEGTQGASLEQWIKEYEWKQRDKIDAYGMRIANLKGDMEAIDDEIERLSVRKQMRRNEIDRMKKILKFAMEMLGTRKLEGQKFTMSIQKNGGAAPVEITAKNVEDIPERFLKVVKNPDLEAIRAALEAKDPEAMGIANLKERGESVRIK